MNELQKLIEKWDEQIALHRRVCEETLMYTKEERLKNSHYAQAICAVMADVKKLTIPDVVGRSEQLVCPHCNGSGEYLDTHPERYGIVKCSCKAN